MVRISTKWGSSCGDYGKIYYSNCTPEPFFDEKDSESWDPKIHGPHNYLQSFYVTALIDECETNKNYPLAMFRNGK